MTMLKDTNENMPAIEEMFMAPKRYWVNVGVRKFFTLDLAEATEFYNRVGDSLYSGQRGSYAGTEILVTEDGPAMYRVELSFAPLDSMNLYACPEGWVSAQHGQIEAERIAENAMSFESITNAYPASDMEWVENVTVSIVRCGAGIVEETTIKWSDLGEYSRAAALGILPVDDDMNNVGRLCTLRTEVAGHRVWKLEKLLKSINNDGRYYFVRNINSGNGHIVSTRDMTNLY